MMKRKLTFIPAAFLLSAAFTLIACGNDDESNNNGTGITPDGKVDVARVVEFKVNFGDYNGDEEVQGTRAANTESGDTLGRQYVELSNGLLAEVTVQKDTATAQTERKHPMTRALADDTYTMLVYKGGMLQGEMSGTIRGGVFTATSSNKSVVLTPATYDFVLFNSMVSHNGNNLTVNRADVETALIGRTTYTVTATPRKQQVTFDMKHAGARMRVKLTGYMALEAGISATLSSVDATSIPGTAVCDASTGTWSTGTGTATNANLTFPASTETKYTSATYTAASSEYQYFLPSTDPSKLKLKFTGGSIYNLNMANAELNLSVPTLASMAANGSYLINVKLMYNFLYLMSDGTTGPFKATTHGGGTKTPIGVVVDKNKRLAVSLWLSGYGGSVQWCAVYNFQQQNYKFYRYIMRVVLSDMDGYKYTWEASGSRDNSTIKGNLYTVFPAFYHAGHNDVELRQRGITLSGGMEKKKWHLPSMGEWKILFTNLGFSKISADNNKWYGNLADIPFRQVGGGSIVWPYDYFWSSTQYDSSNPVSLYIFSDRIEWSGRAVSATAYARGFVYY